MSDYDGPHITGIYIRAELPGKGFCSVDIADPALPEKALQDWLESNDKDALVRTAMALVRHIQ